MKRALANLWAFYSQRRCIGKGAIVGVVLAALLFSCAGRGSLLPSAPPTPTPQATPTTEPADPALPTETAAPSATATMLLPAATLTHTPVPSPTAAPPAAAMTDAKVLGVIDGDTIQVEIDGEAHTVRYIGIDAPEFQHPESSVQSPGRDAAAANEQLVAGKTVRLEKDVSETDQYGRLLRYVWVGDMMVNAELVRLGYARAIPYPPDVKHQERFVALQREAQESARGLWASTPVPTALPTQTSAPMAAPSQPTVPPATSAPVLRITAVD